MNTVYEIVKSPVGRLLLTATDRGITRLWFEKDGRPHAIGEDWLHLGEASGRAADIVADACTQLATYFVGDRNSFDLPLDANGSPFQLRVWQELREIPFGQTISYGELARRIGDPHAMRAVGSANGRNPIAIIVPCHRVIGANGALTGYGGGMERKRWLLEHEGALSEVTYLQLSL